MLKKIFVLFLFAIILSIPQANAGTITANGFYQGDVFKFIRASNHALRNHSLGNFGIARGVTATENVLSATTTNYVIHGILYSLNPSSDIDLSGITGASSLPVQGASISKNYLLHIGSDGLFRVNMSASNTYPDGIDGYAPVALLQVGTLAGGSYTFGTTKLGATSVNYTITNLVTIPSGNYGVKLTY